MCACARLNALPSQNCQRQRSGCHSRLLQSGRSRSRGNGGGVPTYRNLAEEAHTAHFDRDSKLCTKAWGGGGFTSLQQRLQEVLQAVGEAAHHVAGVAVLRQEEGQLEVWVLLQLDFPPVAPRQLVRGVFCHRHHVVYQFLHTDTHTHTGATQASAGNKKRGSPGATVRL